MDVSALTVTSAGFLFPLYSAVAYPADNTCIHKLCVAPIFTCLNTDYCKVVVLFRVLGSREITTKCAWFMFSLYHSILRNYLCQPCSIWYIHVHRDSKTCSPLRGEGLVRCAEECVHPSTLGSVVTTCLIVLSHRQTDTACKLTYALWVLALFLCTGSEHLSTNNNMF